MAAALLLVLAACEGSRIGPPPDSPWLGRVSFALAANSGRDLPFGPFNPDPSGRFRELKGTFSCRGLVRWAYETQHAEVLDGRLDLFVGERWCTSLAPPATISTTC